MSFRFAARMNYARRSFVREILKVTDRPDVISFAGGLPNPEVGRWLNRLSLLLFVLGRYEENLAGRPAKPARSSHPGRSN